ncbi:MAG: S41 family peptidase [Spirochaetes bacterium]|nr:S41 family peptidase [Spirochaetota bacterium]
MSVIKMKLRERFIWMMTVSILLLVLLFGVFVPSACAGNSDIDSFYVRKLKSVLETLRKNYVDEEKIDEEVLINGAIEGMLSALDDPHTVYLNEKDMKEMRETSTGKFGGVGMIISQKDDFIVVVSPIEGSPAFRKGLQSGDMIISVEGESTKGITVEDAAKKLRGEPGTKVKIEFLRNNVKYEAELKRALIDVPTVRHTTIDDQYGYLRISQFAGTTAKNVKKVLREFKKNQVEGIVIDLRFNPGGLLEEVIDIVDFFQDEGIIVSTKGRDVSGNEVASATPFGTIVPKDIPVIVLIDNASASASEIFSGALKDHQRGILIGEKTYGKGSVQTIRIMGKDGFKFTIAKYYTPSDISIDGIGIEPHINVPEPELSDEENEILSQVFKDNIIDEFVEKNPQPTEKQKMNFIDKMIADGYKLPVRILRRLLRNALNISQNNNEIYDLDYDLQLQKAVEVLDKKLYHYQDGKYLIKE